MTPARKAGWLRLYFGATPLFALADFLLGANVRAAALAGHSGWRVSYYAVCFACGAALQWKPDWASAVGLFDSSINLILLCLSILAPYYGLVEQIASGGTPANPFTPSLIANFLIVGTVWTVTFYQRQRDFTG